MARLIMKLYIVITLSVIFGYSNEAALSEEERFDCYPEHGNQSLCEARGCQWKASNTKGVPLCFYKENYQAGYELIGEPKETLLGHRLSLKRITYSSIYGDDIDSLTLDIEFQTENRIRFKFYDASTQRYEVPMEMPKVNKKASTMNYEVKYPKKKPFVMQITRKDTKAVLWDSSVGLFVFSDQFLQISTKTASSYVYGIGEQEHPTFRHDMKWKTWPIFTGDRFPFCGHNAYGHHVFHMCLEDDGKAHGIFLLNSNAMEMVLQPLPAITYRTIGGILDFYMFLGPSPETVASQYTEAIGRTFIPPYWSLGFQLGRWGYNSLEKVKAVLDGMRKYDIPQDVQYGDINYMIRGLDFTYDKKAYAGLPEFVRSAKKDGLRYIIILDPAIGANETSPHRPYDLGNTMDIWVKDKDGKPLFGKMWPTYENVVVNSSLSRNEQTRLYAQWATFPDYFHQKAKEYWGILIKEFYKEVEFDALWLDMNEPVNFVTGAINGCPNTKWDYPPYKPKSVYGAVLADKTLCMSAKHGSSLHYNLHSLYGWKQSVVTQQILQDFLKKRSLVLSRSTFASSGKYSGHWLGDNISRWDQLHVSIIGMLEFNLFGIPYIGADVCGFFDNPTEEMCQRWMQLGAFYPFSRNNNGFRNKPQDPASFGPEFAKASRKVLHSTASTTSTPPTIFTTCTTTSPTAPTHNNTDNETDDDLLIDDDNDDDLIEALANLDDRDFTQLDHDLILDSPDPLASTGFPVEPSSPPPPPALVLPSEGHITVTPTTTPITTTTSSSISSITTSTHTDTTPIYTIPPLTFNFAIPHHNHPFYHKIIHLIHARHHHHSQIITLTQHISRSKVPNGLLPTCHTTVQLTPPYLNRWNHTLHQAGLELTGLMLQHHQQCLAEISSDLLTHTQATQEELGDKQKCLEFISSAQQQAHNTAPHKPSSCKHIHNRNKRHSTTHPYKNISLHHHIPPPIPNHHHSSSHTTSPHNHIPPSTPKHHPSLHTTPPHHHVQPPTPNHHHPSSHTTSPHRHVPPPTPNHRHPSSHNTTNSFHRSSKHKPTPLHQHHKHPTQPQHTTTTPTAPPTHHIPSLMKVRTNPPLFPKNF